MSGRRGDVMQQLNITEDGCIFTMRGSSEEEKTIWLREVGPQTWKGWDVFGGRMINEQECCGGLGEMR
jgi:hypothetical protein